MLKTISDRRSHLQSAFLVTAVGGLLAVSVGLGIFVAVGMTGPPPWFLWSIAGSAAFAFLVWRLRASTARAAIAGGFICIQAHLKLATGVPWRQTAVPELIALFLLTFAATRFGRRRSHQAASPEARHGRNTAQVLANLGFAALWCAMPDSTFFVVALAALAEATADTVSSEMGHALGGTTLLITSLSRVPPGTDGGISLAGSALGIGAAAIMAALPLALHAIDPTASLTIFLAACSGLFLDSLLGATVERHGWIGNDLVNFSSTVFAGIAAYCAIHLLAPPLPYW